MPKYLIQGSYTESGLQGLLKDGGSKRIEETRKAIEKLGGQLEVFYFSFGSDDFTVILDLPSDAHMTALALDAQATGTVKSRVTVLITPEDVDQAVKKTVSYRAPGE